MTAPSRSVPFFVAGPADPATRARWEQYRARYPGFGFHLATERSGLLAWLESVAEAGAPHAAVSLDPLVSLPAGFPGAVAAAVGHADGLVDRWLVLSAGGRDHDLRAVDYGFYGGAPSIRYSRDLTPCLAPFPQVQIWNLPAFRRLPRSGRIPGGERSDLTAVWAGPAAGLASFVSPHLHFGRRARPDSCPPESGQSRRPSPPSRFDSLDEDIPTALVALGCNDTETCRAVARGPLRPALLRAVAAAGLRGRLQQVVRRSRPDARVTVVIRTTLSRGPMLHRTLASLQKAAVLAPLHEVLLSSEDERLLEACEELKARFPNLPLQPAAGPRPAVPSRTANLIAGAGAATGDYVWFLDDDDLATPRSLAVIQDAVATRYHPILIGDCDVFQEKWSISNGRPERLEHRSRMSTYRGSAWTTAFSGRNPVPICAVVYPRGVVQRAADERLLRHHLSQDYALLLAALNDPEAEVRVIPRRLAEISMRSDPASDNAGAVFGAEERTADIGGFMADIFSPSGGYRAVLAQLGGEVAHLARENRRLRARLGRPDEDHEAEPARPGTPPGEAVPPEGDQPPDPGRHRLL